jgi:hypothetical protein
MLMLMGRIVGFVEMENTPRVRVRVSSDGGHGEFVLGIEFFFAKKKYLTHKTKLTHLILLSVD